MTILGFRNLSSRVWPMPPPDVLWTWKPSLAGPSRRLGRRNETPGDSPFLGKFLRALASPKKFYPSRLENLQGGSIRSAAALSQNLSAFSSLWPHHLRC